MMAEKADGLAVINLPFFHAGATAIGQSTVNISIKAGYDYLKTLVYAFYKLGFKRIFFLSMHGPAYLTINSVCMVSFMKRRIRFVIWTWTRRKSQRKTVGNAARIGWKPLRI